MKKKIKAMLSTLCYLVGIVGAIYVGGYLMLICPIRDLLEAFQAEVLTLHLLVVSIIKIACSTTVAGAVWCTGYIGYNYFIGTEDEYDRLMKQLQEEKKERRLKRQEKRKSRQKEKEQ